MELKEHGYFPVHMWYVSVCSFPLRESPLQPSLKVRPPGCPTVTRPEVTRLQGPSWFGWLDATLKGFDAQGSLQTVKITPVLHELPNRHKFSRHKMSLGKHTIDNCLDTRLQLVPRSASTSPCFCYSQPIIKHLQFFYTHRSKTGRTRTHLS